MIYGTCVIDSLCQCQTRGVSVKCGFDQERMRVVQKWLIMYVSENSKISVLWISALFRSIFSRHQKHRKTGFGWYHSRTFGDLYRHPRDKHVTNTWCKFVSTVYIRTLNFKPFLWTLNHCWYKQTFLFVNVCLYKSTNEYDKLSDKTFK